MFEEEARWLERALAAVDLAPGAAVLDIGSSTREFRTVTQPYIDAHVFAPLRGRDVDVVHLDAKPEDGVDVVCDVTDPAADVEAALGRTFDVVLCCNLLEHVTDREATVARVTSLVASGGTLIVTVPGRYRYHEDPIDTMYRPSPEELARLVAGGHPDFVVEEAGTVRIRDRSRYNLRSRYLRERFVEAAFWLLPSHNWRQSCVRLRRA